MPLRPNSNHVYRDVFIPVRYLYCDHGTNWSLPTHDLGPGHLDQCFLSVSVPILPVNELFLTPIRLSSGSFLLFFAKVADTFGRKSLLIFSMGAFAVSSLIAGFSTNAMYLDVFGGLLGFWSAAAVPPAIGILGAAYEEPSRRKNRAFACFSAGNPVGFVMGSVFSGVAAHLFNWRASFYLLAVIYVVFFVGALWTIPRMQVETEKFNLQTFKRFDLFGILLSMAGIALFCSSLT
jgi:MFS family permease